VAKSANRAAAPLAAAAAPVKAAQTQLLGFEMTCALMLLLKKQ
jgi:hypothetical protein